MRVQDEAVYLLNNEKYLHLRENTSGVGYATYDKLTLLPLEKGQIPFEHLPPDGRNAIPAARNWFLFELSDDPRRAIQLESVRILDNIPDSGIRKRRIWEDPSITMNDVRLIDSNYKDLYRVPNGSVIQVDYPDDRSFTTRLEHWDEYHFDVGGLGDMFHICQFAEVMERNGASYYPEIQTQDEVGAWELGGKGYIAIQSCDDGWDYTLYHSDYSVMDSGQIDAPELTIQEVREEILEAHHMEKGRRLIQDYDFIMDRAAEAEELGANHRPSTLEHQPHPKQPLPEKKFGLLVDIPTKMAEGKTSGYKKWATKFNLKEMSKTLLYLQEKKIDSADELRERAAAATERYHTLGDSIKAAEKRMGEIAVLRAHIVNYAKTRDAYAAYRKAGYSKKFLEAHREEIELHKAAKAAFDEADLKKLPKVKDLNVEYSELLSQKKIAYPEYRKAKEEMQELVRAQKNVERFFAEEKQMHETEQVR